MSNLIMLFLENGLEHLDFEFAASLNLQGAVVNDITSLSNLLHRLWIGAYWDRSTPIPLSLSSMPAARSAAQKVAWLLVITGLPMRHSTS